MNVFRHLRSVVVLGICLCSSIEVRADLITNTPSGSSPGDGLRWVFDVAARQAEPSIPHELPSLESLQEPALIDNSIHEP